jgi:ABC-type sugar transport system substrate-binding protein
MLPMIKGFQDAGQQLGIDVTFRGNQETNDFAAAPVVKRMLENAIATKPDGIVISDQYPDVPNDTIKEAVAAGIPVVLTNAVISGRSISERSRSPTGTATTRRPSGSVVSTVT